MFPVSSFTKSNCRLCRN